MNRTLLVTLCTSGVAMLAMASEPTFGRGAVADIDTRGILEQAASGRQWPTYGGTYDEQRYSPLTGITPANIGALGVAWTYEFPTSHGVEATPIVVDGVIYVSGAWSVVAALDAKTGKVLWQYDPKVPRGQQVLMEQD